MRRPVYLAPPRNTPLRIALGFVINALLLGVLFARAHNAMAVLVGLAVLVLVMMHCDHQGWGPLTRSVAGICAGLVAFLAMLR